MIDLTEYEICINGHDEVVYLYHRGCRMWVTPDDAVTMADLMEAIYDHDSEYHQ